MSDVYSIVTEKITAALEAGTVPWHKPWASTGMPRNLVSRRPYRGMNVLLLSLGQPYTSPWWLTFKQAQDLGGHVRKGESASLVTFWKFDQDSRHTGGDDAPPSDQRVAPILRYYNLFNVEQCEGIVAPEPDGAAPQHHDPIAECERILAGMPQRPEIRRDPSSAYYSPLLDYVGIPDLCRFETAESYYATVFHELAHATGHPSRLNRETLTAPAAFGTPDYSKEELVAEFSAAFLCGHAGIFPRVLDNTAAYLAGWLAVLKKDKRLLVVAAAQAQKAADFILGTTVAPQAE